MYPRVLVISNNPFSKVSNNGKTYYSFFQGWPKEKLAQLYFSNEKPVYDICDKYFTFNSVENMDSDTLEKNTLPKKSRNKLVDKLKKSQLINYLYNLVWESKINSNKERINKFIREFNPEVIFFVGGRSNYTYKLLNYIHQKYDVPYCIYYTDDYFVPENNKLFTKLNYNKFKNEAQLSIEQSKKLFVISQKMEHEYEALFSKQCIPIMNSIDLTNFGNIKPRSITDDMKIAYFGGLHLKRFETIIKIARQLENYNDKYKQSNKILIYTMNPPDDNQDKLIKSMNCIEYKGSVNSEDIIREMEKQDVLLFVESFNRDMINRTRLSLSTKIPEYLAMGKPIFAIGPNESGSIEYLKSLGFVNIVTKQDDSSINKAIKDLKNSNFSEKEIFDKSRKFVEDNHSYEKTHETLRRELSLCLK